MSARRGFAVGLILGLALGAGGMLLLRPDVPQQTGLLGAEGASTREPEHVATLETRTAKGEPDLSSGPQASAPQQPEANPPAKQAETAADAAYSETLEDVRARLRAARESKPGSESVIDSLRAFRKLVDGENPRIARLGGRALIYLAGQGLLRDEDVRGLRDEFGRLRAGARARPALAGAVALAWARDKRLGDWLRGLPAEAEPEIRATVVEALDESASAAYREYLLELSRSEKNAQVLEHAWHEDPITVAMTRQWAPRLIAAVERRVEEGGLTPVVRGRALFAIGLTAVHEPASAAASIGRLVAEESDAGVGAYGRAVLHAIEQEEANVQTLDRLWAEHRRTFAEK